MSKITVEVVDYLVQFSAVLWNFPFLWIQRRLDRDMGSCLTVVGQLTNPVEPYVSCVFVYRILPVQKAEMKSGMAFLLCKP